ncbi:hypothetical protein OG607_25015 [Streptomyces sp. NBC_01537]|uniref:hypothetical protein n=1 Tax=Streptomyces sp. NBC_01537 TaxID=2903896 RepID=UPI00386A8758
MNESIGLSVTGRLHADVVDVDATMLFVFGGAEVKRLINFTTTDGTISIAGKTECPLVIYDEGDTTERLREIPRQDCARSSTVVCRTRRRTPFTGCSTNSTGERAAVPAMPN